MSKNEYKDTNPTIPEKEVKQKKPSKQGKLGGILISIFDGTVLTRTAMVRLLPFILYCSLLIVVYIGNSYYSEKVIKKSNKTRNELIELQYEYISTKSDLMHISKLSELTIKLDSLKTNIKPSTVPPIKIFETVKTQPKK